MSSEIKGQLAVMYLVSLESGPFSWTPGLVPGLRLRLRPTFQLLRKRRGGDKGARGRNIDVDLEPMDLGLPWGRLILLYLRKSHWKRVSLQSVHTNKAASAGIKPS